ncbi:MAG: hypothetical protein QNJ19_05780 [Woeseiaceae bacterium]|nr:hypothetical protein [Woeseiaceae bacterium]
MRICLFFIMLLPMAASAEIFTIDFVKVVDGNDEEAIYYYENNWKRHRIEAASRSYISSYKLLVKQSDDGQTDILLITGYASEADYEQREANFQEVMRETGKDGPRLMNDKKPGEFRKVFDSAVYIGD